MPHLPRLLHAKTLTPHRQVEQYDTLLPTLSVEEMLMYTAELKRPVTESAATKRAAVDVTRALFVFGGSTAFLQQFSQALSN